MPNARRRKGVVAHLLASGMGTIDGDLRSYDRRGVWRSGLSTGPDRRHACKKTTTSCLISRTQRDRQSVLIGHTRPRSVISPVIATSRRVGMPVITDADPVVRLDLAVAEFRHAEIGVREGDRGESLPDERIANTYPMMSIRIMSTGSIEGRPVCE